MDILIGSRALKYHLGKKLNREPKDWDYFSNTRDSVSAFEIENPMDKVEVFYDSRLEKYNWSSKENAIATLNELYTIKVSHVFWDLKHSNWKQHMNDIMLMKDNGACLIPELYEILYSIWEDIHGKKKVNLSQEEEKFFSNRVKRKYVHDTVHNSVSFYDKPMFNKILRDDSKVAVDKEKFDKLSFDDKKKLVYEEAFVIALERKVFESEGMYWKSSYVWALQKIIQDLSKGWFPLFIVDNFKEFKKAPFNYYELSMKNKDKLVEIV